MSFAFSSTWDIPSIPVMVLSLFCFFVIFAVLKHVCHAFFGPLSKVPGPKLWAFTDIPYLRRMWRGEEVDAVDELHKKFGPVIRLAPDLVAVLGNGQTWKEVLGFKPKGQQTWSKDLSYFDRNVNNTPGPITSDTEVNVRMRKIISPSFSDQALKRYEDRLKSWAGLLKHKLGEQASDGVSTDLVKMLNCAAFDIMSDLTFAEPLNMLNDGEYTPWVSLIFGSIKFAVGLRVLRYLSRFTRVVLDFSMSRIPAIRKIALEHHLYVVDRVDRRLGQPPAHPDVWSQFERQKDVADTLSLEEHYSIANELMIAGTETTATTLSGTMFYLSQNPYWLQKVTGELRKEYSTIEDVTLNSLQQNRTLNAIISETMRMYPPLPIGLPRVVPSGGAMIDDYFLPAKTRVSIFHIPTYRSPQNFRHPDEFHPERWLGDPKFKDDNFDAFEPFQVGPRSCIGKNFAWHEMRLLLSTVLIPFDVRVLPESLNWRDQKVFALWDKGPLWCKLTEVNE